MITITVSYRLREYLPIVIDLISAKRDRKGLESADNSSPTSVSFLHRILIYTLATPVFFYKVARVGECTFRFTPEVLIRESKTPTKEVPWGEFINIYRLSQAYFFEKREGGMPVPYRCLTTAEQEELELFLSENGYSKS